MNRYIILGLGISGNSVASFLSKKGKSFLIYDDNLKNIEESVKNSSLSKSDIFDFKIHDIEENDIIVLTPGMTAVKTDKNLHKIVKKAFSVNATVCSPFDIFKRNSPVNQITIGITGSVGKSTVIQMIGNIISALGTDVAIGGNIGIPYFDIKPFDAKYKVIELSSYELENSIDPSANISVITNVFPHHLARHKTFKRYVDAKLRIISENSYVILNADDKNTHTHIIPEIKNKFGEDFVKNNLTFFSTSKTLPNGTSIIDGVCYIEQNRINIEIPENMRQPHTLLNLACAIEVVRRRMNLDVKKISQLLKNTENLEHRNNNFLSINNISFINDSKSTCHISTAAAILSYPKNVILIAGGKIDENDSDLKKSLLLNNKELITPLKRVLKVFLIGEVGSHYKKSNTKNKKFTAYKDIKVATRKAYELASKLSEKNPEEKFFILLSPGFQSFDQFDNFMHRGNVFKEVCIKIAEERKSFNC